MIQSWTDLRISMLLTGSELVDGRLQDSNSLFLARFLFERGQRLNRIIVCDDNHSDIVDSLNILAERSDVIITSGGLGPTTGDKTREAISSFLGVHLRTDLPSLEKIKKFFKDRNRAYESNNDKQALIPESSIVLSNDYGTAVCFASPFKAKSGNSVLICALPGVPRELEQLIPEQVLPAIISHFSLGSLQAFAPVLYPIRVFGLGESAIGARVVESEPTSKVEVSYRATFPEVQVLFRGTDSSVSKKEVEFAALNAIQKIGGDFVFSQGESHSLIEVVHGLLMELGTSLACAESCSGGMLSSLITRMPGSSKYFLGSVVSYSNGLKQSLLGVPEDLLLSQGAVSAEVARAMADGAKLKTGAAIAVSITGIAGPDGGSIEKPVGTCFLGLSDSIGTISTKIFFPGPRERIRQHVSYAALDLIRRRLLGLAIDKPIFLQLESYSNGTI